MTRIGLSLRINGELESDEDILVEGHVSGHVHMRGGTLTVADQGTVEADVRGATVLVRGRVDGNITASERIELTAAATVRGSLSANRVVLADGAHFNGGIDMHQRTIAAKLAQHRAANGVGQGTK